MTREQQYEVASKIVQTMTAYAPHFDYTSAEVADALEKLSDKELMKYIREGYFTDDFEAFYVTNKFLSLFYDMPMDEDFRKNVISHAKLFTESDLYDDEYMKCVKVPSVSIGKFLLTEVSYLRGEFFQYDMPYIDDDTVYPLLGFFTEAVRFPTIYEGDMPWMSVCPSEMNTMKISFDKAHGNTLVLGLGLGYFPFHISLRDSVRHITIVERQKEIIELFEKHLLLQFPHRDKITVVQADAFEYLSSVKVGQYDFCYADIWESDEDGAVCYQKIKPHDERLVGTHFEYWIEKEILRRLSHQSADK